jgi:pimeloyl-ACP methyl ester carboxylesterase
VIALSVGLFGVVSGGVEPFHYGRAVGLSGDDWSGLLASAAGATMLGLGGWRLWTSRRRDGGRVRRWLRRGGLSVAAALTLQFVALPVVFAYVITHVARAGVDDPHLGAPYEDVRLTTSDGLDLEGWYVPSRNGAAVLAFPGRTNPQPHTRMLVEHGYGVLLLDRRGEGASDGDGNMYGWGGTRDIHAAVAFLEQRADVDPGRVAGIGFSVGGELMLQAAAEDPDGLDAVISEGAGTRSMREQHAELDARTFWTNGLGLAVRDAAVTVFADETPPAPLTEVVPRIAPRPALLIWAPNGGNQETMTPVYGRLIGSSAEVWSIPDAMHMRGLQAHPVEYERRVVGFLDRSLPATAG